MCVEFSLFPSEVLECIFQNMDDHRQLARIKVVCRTWNNIISEVTKLWLRLFPYECLYQARKLIGDNEYSELRDLKVAAILPASRESVRVCLPAIEESQDTAVLHSNSAYAMIAEVKMLLEDFEGAIKTASKGKKGFCYQTIIEVFIKIASAQPSPKNVDKALTLVHQTNDLDFTKFSLLLQSAQHLPAHDFTAAKQNARRIAQRQGARQNADMRFANHWLLKLIVAEAPFHPEDAMEIIMNEIDQTVEMKRTRDDDYDSDYFSIFKCVARKRPDLLGQLIAATGNPRIKAAAIIELAKVDQTFNSQQIFEIVEQINEPDRLTILLELSAIHPSSDLFTLAKKINEGDFFLRTSEIVRAQARQNVKEAINTIEEATEALHNDPKNDWNINQAELRKSWLEIAKADPRQFKLALAAAIKDRHKDIAFSEYLDFAKAAIDLNCYLG